MDSDVDSAKNLSAIEKIPIYDEARLSKAVEKQQLHAIEHVARDASPQKEQGELTSEPHTERTETIRLRVN